MQDIGLSEEEEDGEDEERESSTMHKQKSRAGLRRIDTVKSTKTNASNKSRANFNKSLKSQKSLTSIFEEEVVEEKPPHPLDAVLGENVNSLIQKTTDGVTIGLNF